MENISGALKSAFAVFIFIVAVSVLFSLISQVNSTADQVLHYIDKTNYYSYKEGSDDGTKRIVTEDEVICALYNQSNNLSHIFINKGTAQIYPNNSYSTLNEFIEKELNSDKTYTEEIVEVNKSGSFIYSEDNVKTTLKKRNNRNIYFLHTKLKKR